jgi:hypothetical protein
VTVTRKFPAGEPWHDKVELPDPPTTEVEDSVQTRLVELVVTARVTVPVNPFNGATVIVEVPLAPAFTVELVGEAETVKFGGGVMW